MAETFRDEDLATLKSIARGAGIADTENMPHDQLVDMLRRAGLAEPDGRPIETDPGGPGGYHARGVGRRESAGGPAAQTSAREDTGRPTRDPAGLSGLPRSDLNLGDQSTGGRAAEEAIGARPGESGTEIDDRTQG